MNCSDRHGVGCVCKEASDEEIVDQIETVQQAMFRLEEMVSKDPTHEQRAALYHVRVDFGLTARSMIGRLKR